MKNRSMYYDCKQCQYRIACQFEFGKERSDGDDYRAVAGTHFCRKSWEPFYKKVKKERK